MPNKYYLREDRKAVNLGDKIGDFWCGGCAVCEACQHEIASLPALDVDPDYLKRLSQGWFEGEERYEVYEYGRRWIVVDKDKYDSYGKQYRRLTIVAPQEAEKGQEGEPRILHGDTSGVCYNCLNGFHKGCDIKSCTCKKKDHKAWWWKTQAEIDSAQAVGVFQSGVREWLLACFGEEISNDIIERNHRFFEEAAELVQATGCTKSECHQLVDYVFDRPKGDPVQEVGGALVTLSALCSASGIDMAKAGETELARIWTKVEKIRAKQAAKPKHSPLPATPQPVTGEDAWGEWLQDSQWADPDDDDRTGKWMVEELKKAFEAGQAASRPSDAVEFAEWMRQSGMRVYNGGRFYNASELYQLFLNSKSPTPNK